MPKGELDEEAMRALAEQDPEVTPGLFQGDMALNNEVGINVFNNN